jgi:outer membrane protein OmpA-like peptidoglycan-associated protein
LPLYFDNDEPDKRTNRTFTRKTYEETVLAYLDRQNEYREKFSAGISENRTEVAENQVDDFFEQEVRGGYERFGQMCTVLLEQLKAGRTVEVFIKGFTSPRARNDYNLNLGKRRISSVKNQFFKFSEGIFTTYLENGKLKITETSFGETSARSGISDDLRDERNSIYHPEAARERRVEIIEIKEKE